MKTKKVFFVLCAVGILGIVFFSVLSSRQPVTVNSIAVDGRTNQISVVDKNLNQSARTAQNKTLAEVQPEQEMKSFKLIEEKYAQLNLAEARQEIHRIDREASVTSLKNFNDFTTKERTVFLNRQREKTVLLNKIIVSRLEGARQ